MPGRDPAHWLHRLDAREWLTAATNELQLAQEALTRRAVRPGVTHARRAAGMALNAMLVIDEHQRWGRSYMDHVAALGADDDAPAPVREAARLLRDTPAAPAELVQLGKPDLRVWEAARTIVAWAHDRVEPDALLPAT